jgi:hypothetical protein
MKRKIVHAKDARRVDRSGTSVARTNRRRVSELTGIPSSLAKRAPAFPALHETHGLQLRCAALRPSSIRLDLFAELFGKCASRTGSVGADKTTHMKF